ncbi:hypothetical protein AX16_005572 [Volvariella volvacea WC 439]|nr:hypothetical protein AX16_005572 [Volvariella volvacea WC 439]
MPSRLDILTFEPNSLYIATQPLVSGKFHWSFLTTNERNEACRHQWYEDPSHCRPAVSGSPSPSPPPIISPVPSSSGAGAEHYYIQPNIRPSACNTTFLAYFKVNGCTLHPETMRVFMDLCSSTFPRSYRTVEMNRAHGMNGRTWALKVLLSLWTMGYIKGRSQSDPVVGLQALEDEVNRRSQALECLYLQAYLFQRKYYATVESV